MGAVMFCINDPRAATKTNRHTPREGWRVGNPRGGISGTRKRSVSSSQCKIWDYMVRFPIFATGSSDFFIGANYAIRVGLLLGTFNTYIILCPARHRMRIFLFALSLSCYKVNFLVCSNAIIDYVIHCSIKNISLDKRVVSRHLRRFCQIIANSGWESIALRHMVKLTGSAADLAF